MVGRLGGCEPRVFEVIVKIQKKWSEGGGSGRGWVDGFEPRTEVVKMQSGVQSEGGGSRLARFFFSKHFKGPIL